MSTRYFGNTMSGHPGTSANVQSVSVSEGVKQMLTLISGVGLAPDPRHVEAALLGSVYIHLRTALPSRPLQRTHIQERDRRSLWVLAVQFLWNNQGDMGSVHLGQLFRGDALLVDRQNVLLFLNSLQPCSIPVSNLILAGRLDADEDQFIDWIVWIEVGFSTRNDDVRFPFQILRSYGVGNPRFLQDVAEMIFE